MTNFSIVRLPSNLIITIDNSKQIVCKGCDDETFKRVIEAKNIDELIEILPDVKEQFGAYAGSERFNARVDASDYLIRKGQSVYWNGVSELSMPKDLVDAVLKAEDEYNYDALEAYKNFWTLMSLNPDSRCRQNLFWFLNRWGMRISKSGLFVGYRNVDVLISGETLKYSQSFCDYVKGQYERIKAQKKSPKNYWVRVIEKDYYDVVCGSTKYYNDLVDEGIELYNVSDFYNEFKAVNFKVENCGKEDEIYTDHHSHTFRIKVGEIVSMPRKECDSVQENSCSRGLHIGGTSWLNKHYFGDQGLVCLVNPAMVCAVP